MTRFRAALHEMRCAECRVTWRSWWQRLIGDERGMYPNVPAALREKEAGRG